MKQILITQRLIENLDYPELRDALDVRWAKLCHSIKLMPILLPSGANPSLYFSELDIKGVLLTGGNDLSAVAEGEHSKRLCRLRDDLELEVLRLAIAAKLPVLGICRGLQLIASHFSIPLEKVTDHVACRHPILVNSQSRWQRHFSQMTSVNSFHGWSPKSENVRSQDLIVSAYTEKNEIEALEHREQQLLGIMWHPERDDPMEQVNLELLSDFFS